MEGSWQERKYFEKQIIAAAQQSRVLRYINEDGKNRPYRNLMKQNKTESNNKCTLWSGGVAFDQENEWMVSRYLLEVENNNILIDTA